MKTRKIEIVFRALSDKTRLRILNLLRGGELCVCEIVSVLDVPQPTASRHLAYLRRAGLVEGRREGQWCHYRLSTAETAFHTKLLECLAACEGLEPSLARDTKRLRRACPAGCPT